MPAKMNKSSPWSTSEVETLLCLVADDQVQKELDGATRNEKVYKEVAKLMEEHGYFRTYLQCREKLKKLKSDYKAIKDQNGRNGSHRKSWRWYDQMDAIYGHRSANNGRESGIIRSSPWSTSEVETLLCLVADDQVHKELDGATRNEKVYKEVAKLMEEHGYFRTYVQCREKLKKLKSDYKAIKDQNGRSGSHRKSWRWYDQMDAIYGHRPAKNGRESSVDSMGLLEPIDNDDFLCKTEEGSLVMDESEAAPSTPLREPPSPSSSTTGTTGKRKRSLSRQEHSAQVVDCLRAMHAGDMAQQEKTRAQRDSHLQLLLNDAREARKQEAELRREEAASRREENAEFNRSVLGVLGQIAEAIRDRRV